MCERDGKGIVLARSCGVRQFVGTDCGDPLCPECEPYRAAKRRKDWMPVAEKMREPMWTIVSLPNDSNLDRGIRELMAARRKFQNFRLGKRNRAQLSRFCHLYNLLHFGDTDAKKWDARVKGFLTRVKNLEAKIRAAEETRVKADEEAGTPSKRKTKKSVRMFDLIGDGFGTLEVTYNPKRDDFHPHANIVTDTAYIPFAVLVTIWWWSSDRRARIFYVRRLSNIPKDMKEIVKYVTKGWEIPESRQADFRNAIKGKKRVWPIGAAKPVKTKEPCPCCGSSECKTHLACMGEVLRVVDTPFGKLLTLRVGSGDTLNELWFVKCHGVWKEPEPESLNLILRALARHSEPAPPMQLTLSGPQIGAYA